MKPNSLAAFYAACAPTPESAAGILPPLDMALGVGHLGQGVDVQLKCYPQDIIEGLAVAKYHGGHFLRVTH